MKRILLFFGLLFLANILIGQTTQKDTVSVKPFEDLTLQSRSSLDTSDQLLIYDISTGTFAFRGTLGELLNKIRSIGNIIGTANITDGEIVDADISGSAGIGLNKLATTGTGKILLTDSGGSGTWVSGTPGYGLTVSGTTMTVDTTSETGIVNKSRLTNALDDVASSVNDVLGWFDVTDYGATPDDNTDNDRDAIQSAINAAHNNNGGGTVYFPSGVYYVSGLVTSDNKGNNPNSVLYIPAQNMIGDTLRAIKLLGEVPPSMHDQHGKYGVTDPSWDGSVIYTDQIGIDSASAIISTKGDSSVGYGTWNFGDLHIENLNFILDEHTGTGPSLSGLHLAEQSGLYINNVSITYDTAARYIPEPVSGIIGIRTGATWCNVRQTLNNVTVQGFRYGIVGSDHLTLQNSYVSFCDYAVGLTSAAHPMHMDRFSSERNQYFLTWVSDDGNAERGGNTEAEAPVISVDQVGFEPGDSQNTPSWIDTDNSARIYDPNNKIRGIIKYDNPQGVLDGIGGSGIRWIDLDKTSTDITLSGTVNTTSTNGQLLKALIDQLADLGYIKESLTVEVDNDSVYIAGLIVDYDASAQTGYTNGAAINSITDQKGDHDIIQNTTSYQPVYQTNILNGEPGFYFNNDFVLRDSLGELADGKDFTIVIVAKADTSNWYNVLLSDLDPSSGFGSGRLSMYLDTRADSSIIANPSTTAGDFFGYANPALDSTQAHVITITMDDSASEMKVYVDGVLEDTKIWTGTRGVVDPGLALGMQHNYGLGLKGWIFRVLIYNKVVLQPGRDLIEPFLMNKYGIN